MIRHIVLFRARKSEDIQAMYDGLERLIAIKDANVLEVKLNERKDSWSDEIDVIVYGEFKDLAALNKFKESPVYKDTIKIVKPLRDIRITADYTVTD